MRTEVLIEKITLDMLEGNQREIAEVIGVECFFDLVHVFGGTNLYIPVMERVLVPAKRKLILSDYPKLTFNELSRKYGMSESHIRKICSLVTSRN